MTIEQITNELMSRNSNYETVRVYENLDRENNYCFRFGKTPNHFSKRNWSEIARDVKTELENDQSYHFDDDATVDALNHRKTQ